MMKDDVDISRFIDEDGKITQLPRKQNVRQAILAYLAEKFEPNHDYAERQVNAICNEWHTFDDCFILRRELVESHLLDRERNGSRYWRTQKNTEEN